MTGAISQDWESCQFPFVLDAKSHGCSGRSGRTAAGRGAKGPLWSCSRSGEAGTILLRNFALGASTPWKRIRRRRGRGTRAARRSMNSSGSMTIWVVPSFVRTLQLQYDLAGAVTLEPFVGDGRPSDIAAELLEFFTLIARQRTAAWRLKAVRVDTQLWGGRHGSA